MNDIKKIKSKITQLNNQCNLENKSIYDILESRNINFLSFFASIGLDISLLDDTLKSILESLVRNLDTRIHFNPSMQSLDKDKIELYSSSLKIDFVFSQNEVKANYESMTKDNEYEYKDMEYMASRKLQDDIQTIHFSTTTITNINIPPHYITSRIPLDKVEIKIEYSDSKSPSKRIKITINKDMLQSDLENIYRILYKYNFALAVSVLYFYPTSLKIIDHEFEMNNFNNR